MVLSKTYCTFALYFKINNMIRNITNKLTGSPSYLKKGDAWLADYFGCSETTIRRIKNQLKEVKRAYVNSL